MWFKAFGYGRNKNTDMNFDGIWPTMVTPFTDRDQIDYNAVSELVEWYITQGVNGIFAVCQSSEMFALSVRERVELARFVLRQVHGRVPVVISGHVGDSETEQAAELNGMAQTGPDALVLLTNRPAPADAGDATWLGRMLGLVKQLPADVPLGIYECPYPFPRLLSAGLVAELARTGHFVFYKDTSCSLTQIADKIAAARGTQLKIFNANSALYLDSLRHGAAGFCGVMGNFHPRLYRALDRLHHDPDLAPEPVLRELSDFLAVSSAIEARTYPVCAKYYLQLEGLPIGLNTRSKNPELFGESQMEEVRGLWRLSHDMEDRLREHSIL